MKVLDSRRVKAAHPSSSIKTLLDTHAEAQLREWVERIAAPRRFGAEPAQNRAAAGWLCDIFESLGFEVERQGRYANVVALPKAPFNEVVLVGAHYDSVPMCPGADHNGSAVTAMSGCAAPCSLCPPEMPVIFVAFKCEAAGLLCSCNFCAAVIA